MTSPASMCSLARLTASRKPSSLRFLSSFFFSSRRRHTRCLSDWSSDVCSSDLAFGLVFMAFHDKWLVHDLQQLIELFLVLDDHDLGAGIDETESGPLRRVAHVNEIGRASCRERG